MSIRKQTTRIAAIPAVLIACFVATLAVHAGETIVSSVPFEFKVGDTTFPAGEYQFQIDQIFPNSVRVSSEKVSTAAIALTRGAGDAASEGAPFVTFNVYGGQRFLAMIQTSDGTVTLSQGRQERSIAKVQSASSVAVVRPSDLGKAGF